MLLDSFSILLGTIHVLGGGGVKNLPNLPTDSTKKLPTVGGTLLRFEVKVAICQIFKCFKNFQKLFQYIVFTYIECILSKNYHFVLEKFAILSQIHDYIFKNFAIYAISLLKGVVFFLSLSTNKGDSSGSVS
jgi:hypothetical protein